MRISDWSSDVCSSDLDAGTCVASSGSSSEQDVYLGCDRLDHRGEALGSGGHGVPIVGDGEEARADKSPRAGTSPGCVIGPGRGAEYLASRGVEDAPRVEQVYGTVADAHASEVDHPGQSAVRSEEHTSEIQSLMRISYA